MRLIQTRYLNDGKGFNDGREATLIQIQNPEDYGLILENIRRTEYYGGQYLRENLGCEAGRIKFDSLLLAAMLDFFKPKSFLEIGCGQGDVIFLLALRGLCESLCGLDISPDILGHAHPLAQPHLLAGDLLDIESQLRAKGAPFDLISGFDILEHLHPKRLDQYLDACLDLAGDDALFFFIIPAFGEDRVFGKVFPLEFEENRAALMEDRPFDYLLAQVTDPPIPQSGHLIWAPTGWWETRLTQKGLVRCTGLERNLHAFFDGHLNRSAKSFYVLRKATKEGKRREKSLVRNRLNHFKAWQQLRIFIRSVRILERRENRELADWETMMWAEDQALETMLASFESRLNLPWLARDLLPALKAWLKKHLP